MVHRVVILASGSGTLAQSIFDAHNLDIAIVAVISDRKQAFVLERANALGIHTEIIPVMGSRQLWNTEIVEKVAAYNGAGRSSVQERSCQR